MIKNSLQILIFVLAFSNAPSALAHGEDFPGPHGGEIRMPGAFHTEVKLDSPGHFRIYLLDVNFENPTVEKSQVEAKLKTAKDQVELSCVIAGTTSFLCKAPGLSLTDKATLIIKSKRSGMQGNEAIYELPLKITNWKKSSPSGGSHKHH